MYRFVSEDIEDMRKMVLTIRELRLIDIRRDYRAIRKRYFGNSIPLVDEVAIVFVSGKIMESIFDEHCLGFCVEAELHHVGLSVIAIAEDSNPVETRLTLLHEMAHLKVEAKWNRNMGHGKYFKKEARRLMAAGALDDWF